MKHAFLTAARRVRERLTTEWYLDLNHDPRRAVAVAGCERSGTTWLANIVNYRNDFRLLFEPLRPDLPFTQGLNQRTYLRPGEPAPNMEALLHKILSGRVRDAHVDHLNTRWLAARRIAKFVRANLLLKWLVTTFPGLPATLLVRHPFAVAASRLRKGWNWYPSIKDALFAQPALRADLLDAHADRFAQTQSDFARLVLIWCVEYFIPFRDLQPGDVHLAFYEDLVERPRESIPPLLAHLGVPLAEQVFNVMEVRSATSSPSSLRLVSADSLLRDATLSRKDIDEALSVLAAFGLDRVYGEEAAPRERNLFGLFSA